MNPTSTKRKRVKSCLLARLRFVLVVALGGASLTNPRTAQASEEETIFFETKIRPVLVAHCYECHGNDPKNIENDLLLTTAQGIRKGGKSGQVIVQGKPNDSLLVLAIRHSESNLQMPADRLPRDVIRDFEQWVARGAFDPRLDENYEPENPASSNQAYDFGEARKHWSYQPLRRYEHEAQTTESRSTI